MPTPEDRSAFIHALVAAKFGQKIFVPGLSRQRAVLADIPEELLLYRKENGRLLADLIEGSELDLLGEDHPRVQHELGLLLLDASKNKLGNIYDELKRVGIQTEPLLITATGTVLNGNRRLAAMRDLLNSGPEEKRTFSLISCAVLPDNLGPAELEVIEASLQMAPETKLNYGWVSRRLKLRRQRDQLGMPVDQIVDASRLTGAASLEQEIAELFLVEEYLRDYLGKGRRYSLVGDCKPLFVGLRARLEASPSDLRSVWESLGFAMIAGRHAVKGPLASQFPFADPLPETLAVTRASEDRRRTLN